MTNLRKLARGQECQIRGPGCSFDNEQTVLCHLTIPGISGMGMKAPDICGAWGCGPCHDLIDGRTPPGDTDLTQLKLEGLLRTLHQLDKQGYL